MKFSKTDLPSNKKFGYFFTFFFAILSIYFYLRGILFWAYLFFIFAVILFIVTVLKAKILLPINKIWMQFGLLLSKITNPLILGIIFFGLFTPISFFMHLIGRDELRLKFKSKTSHWISRSEQDQPESFNQQF